MKNKILAAFILGIQFLFPQNFSHPLRADEYSRIQKKSVAAFPDTLNILAILVQYQPDTDTRTSGNGQFDLSVSSERIIDPPPHDSAYVADHFTFAKNYFAKASNNKQHISSTVLGRVITLSKQMKEYSPVNNSNLPLAAMVEESWQAADSLYPGFPFHQYDLFFIIHAGVGRDIDMRAAIGYDPTPLDIPSLYFSFNALKGIFGNTYQGVPLKNSSTKITNTAVLPETEVRKIPSVGGDIVLKLGINGVLVASIASHLGLPDLFDTKTGKSGIGRFGLMDGQSIFSFYGISPPEPSAWEKTYLGWTTPIEILGNTSLSIPAVGLYNTGNDTIYKIPISSKEYYLVENRHRDAKGDGQTVYTKWNGQLLPIPFSQDHSYFSADNIDSAYGIIIDVDELDWNLPGLINAYNNYKGGILIWHIDETIIEKNLAGNSINADPSMRGVDLEEADGSQDIGQSYDFGDPASGSEDGSPIDYWFSGNIFPDYKNSFSESTNPNSFSNTYARSHITIGNFSVQAPRMAFQVNVGGADIQLRKLVKRPNRKSGNNDAPTSADLNQDGIFELIYTSGDSIYVLKDDGTPFLNNLTGLFSPFGGRFQPVVIKILSRNETVIAGVQGNVFSVFSPIDANADGIADLLYTAVSSAAFTTPVGAYSNVQTGFSYFIAGDSSGRRLTFRNDSPAVWTRDSVKFFSSPILGIALTDTIIMYTKDSVAAATSNRFGFGGKSVTALASASIENTYALFTDNSFTRFSALPPSATIQYNNVPAAVTGGFAVYDINGDGNRDLILGAADGLYAFNENGVFIENFPFKTKDGGAVIGSPVIAKKKSSNDILIFFGSTNGHLYAIDAKGKMVPGFPLQTGGIASSPLLWNNNLSIASTDSALYTWIISGFVDTAGIYWGGFLGDVAHRSIIASPPAGAPKSSELLPKQFAYNWPNPVYRGSTYIRYFLGKPAAVNIKIINLAGELVEEFTGTSFAGMDNEVEWNISKIQSGIYFAQITASGNGEEMSQIVKIAVVK